MNPKSVFTLREYLKEEKVRRKKLRTLVHLQKQLCEWATQRANEIRSEQP